ncbi:hypothetical protein SCM07_02325 [Legionella pneumophila serogroup 1]
MQSHKAIRKLHRVDTLKRLRWLINNAYQEAIEFTPTNLYERVQINDAIKQLPVLSACLNSKTKLKHFLAVRWQQIKGTYLGYTSTPNSFMTKICCEVANYLAEQSKLNVPDHPVPALMYLMPGMNCFSEGKYNYVDINSYDNVSRLALIDVVKFYITITNENDEDWLVPISLLKHINLATSEEVIEKILINPFTGQCLSEKDTERLTRHSVITEMLMKSYYRFHSLSRKSSSLYSAVEVLIAGLQGGGEHAFFHGGTRGFAGVKAYIALEEFRNYWKRLSSEQQAKARENRELDMVLNTAILNPNWKDSCVETLAESLARALANDKGELTTICLEKSQIDSLLVVYRENFTLYKKSLEDALEKTIEYDGKEILPLGSSQVMDLDEHAIQNPHDVLILLKDLNPQDLALFCSRFKNRIATSIGNLNGLIEVFLGLNEQQIITLTRIIARRFKNLVNRNEFITLLDFLNEERMNAFLQGLGKRIWNFINPTEMPIDISENKKILLWKNIQRELIPISTDLSIIKEIVSALPEQQGLTYLNNIGNKLIEFSTDIYHCIEILGFLPEDCQMIYLSSVWDILIKFTNNIYHFMILLCAMQGKNKEDYLNKIESKLIDITTNHEELEKIFWVLSKDKKERYLNDMKENKEYVFNEYMRSTCCNFLGKIKSTRVSQSGLLQEIESAPSFDIELFKEKISHLLSRQGNSHFDWLKEKANHLFSKSTGLTFFHNKPDRLDECLYQVLDDNPDEFLAIRMFVFNIELTNSHVDSL